MMSSQPQPTSVPATAKLSVELEAQQWNIVMMALGETAYRTAAPIIQTMGDQLTVQAEQLSQPQSAEVTSLRRE